MLAGKLILSIGLTKGSAPLKRSISELPSLNLQDKNKIFFIGTNNELINYARSLTPCKESFFTLSPDLKQSRIKNIFNSETKVVIIENIAPGNSLSVNILKLIPQLLECGIHVLTSACINNFSIAQKELKNRLNIEPGDYCIDTPFLKHISRVIVVNNLKEDNQHKQIDSHEQDVLSHIAFMIATHINYHNRNYLCPQNNNEVDYTEEKQNSHSATGYVKKLVSNIPSFLNYLYYNQLQIIPGLMVAVSAFILSLYTTNLDFISDDKMSILLTLCACLLNYFFYSFAAAVLGVCLNFMLYFLSVTTFVEAPNTLTSALALIMITAILHLANQNRKLVNKECKEINEKAHRWDALNTYAETLTMASSIKEIFKLSHEYFQKTLKLDIILVLEPAEPDTIYKVITSQDDLTVANTLTKTVKEAYLQKYTEHTFLPLLSKDETSLGYVGIKPLANQNKSQVVIKDEILLNSSTLQLAIAIQKYQLTKSYNDAVLTSEKEQLRSIILSSISHDLKTPLTTIIGSCTALQELENLPEKSKIMLIHTIHEASNHLNHFISNILESSRLASESILKTASTVYLDDVVNVVLQRCKKNIRLFDISVKIANPEKSAVHGDFTLIQQVLFNVIENATKYSPIGSKITILIVNIIDKVLIKISDEGPGIQENKRSKIFDKFYRFHHADSTKAGTGLGLAICKQIIDAYNGKIWASDRDDGLKGSQFNIELKAAFSNKNVLRENGKINNVS